jgi:hypothetical protein
MRDDSGVPVIASACRGDAWIEVQAGAASPNIRKGVDVLGAGRWGKHMSDDHQPRYRVRGGGLMRCLRSLEQLEMTAAERSKEGDKPRCYCSHDMICRDDAWEWMSASLRPGAAGAARR